MQKQKKKKKPTAKDVVGGIVNLLTLNHNRFYHMSKKRAEQIVSLDEDSIVDALWSAIQEDNLRSVAKKIKSTAAGIIERKKQQEERVKAQREYVKKAAAAEKKRLEDAKKHQAQKLILKETLTKEQLADLRKLFNVAI